MHLRLNTKRSPDCGCCVGACNAGGMSNISADVHQSLFFFCPYFILSDTLLFLLTLTAFTPPPLPVNFERDKVCIATHLEREAEAEETEKRVEAEERKAP